MTCKKFIGVLKYNSVFVTDESLNRLQEQGFGAKLFKPLPKHHVNHERASAVATPTAPAQNVESLNNSAEIDAIGTTALSTNAGQINNGIELSTVDTADSDLIDALAILTDKDEQDVDKSMNNMFEGNKVEEIIDEKAASLSLMLLDEEAFFLYTHDYLQLVTLNGSPVTSSLQLWHKFCEKNSKFPIKYKVYTFFRDRGYVVKTAVHFGFDYAVYRTIPMMSHSEICALVVDATKPLDITSSYKETEASSCQQGWRHISTLTRVMPDVMKLMTICYVLPVGDVDDSTATLFASKVESSSTSASDPSKDVAIGKSEKVLNLPPLNMDKLYSGLTGRDSCESIDYTTPKCLDDLVVRPVTTLVRRLIAKSDNYQSIQGVQAKYRSMSILKKARQERVSKKKRRKRRDVVEIRSKVTSKHNRMWQSLAKPSAGTDGNEKRKNKEKKKNENRQKQENRVEKKKEPVANDFADNYHTIFSVNNSPYTSDTEKRNAAMESVTAAVVDLSDAASAEMVSTMNTSPGAEQADDAVSVNRSCNNSPVTHSNMGFENKLTTILEEVIDVGNDLINDNARTSNPMDAVTSTVPSGGEKMVAVKSSTKPVRKNTTSTKKENKRILSSETIDSPARSELDGQHDRLVAAGDGVATPLRRSTRIKK